MTNIRQAIYVNCDGLGREWVNDEWAPALYSLSKQSLWCEKHCAVFPSVTRTSAASITTGCHPERHGLHGNRMGLVSDGKIKVRDVGQPDFRDHMRAATGRTLRVPTMAERIGGGENFVAFSNVSPGAAYFLDPDAHGYVYHRAGSFGPGGAKLTSPDALSVSHDIAGDIAMTIRFCEEVLLQRRPNVSVLWLANPDSTLHGTSLGSPEHKAAMVGAEQCVSHVIATMQQLRAQGDDVLLMVGSDHGQETIGEVVDIGAWLIERGLKALVTSGDIAVAGQGTAALLYATDTGWPALEATLGDMKEATWCDEIRCIDRTRSGDGLAAQVNMATMPGVNEFGVVGKRYVVEEPGKPQYPGHGQHGGWGVNETQPFLLVNHPNLEAGVATRQTSLVDIAPTILQFLAVSSDGMDGRPIANPSP